MNKLENNPFLRRPDHPNYNRRARHHDYRRPARYLITALKNPSIPAFSKIEGDISLTEGGKAPHPIISPTGNFIIEALEIWREKFNQIELSGFVIMPDHIHLCLNVREYLPNGLSLAISGLKGIVSRLRHAALPDHLRPGNMEPVFTKGFNDRIAYNQEQWEKQKHYVNENPRRYLFKKRFPDFLLLRWIIKIGDDEFCAKGNIMLLKEPLLFAVKHHRKWSETESEAYQKECKTKIDNGEIPVSPFIHPKEKEIRNHAIEEGGCYIRICENGFAEKQSASGYEFDLMATGRLLLIAPHEHDSQKREMKYTYAQKLNSIAARLVALHDSGMTGRIRPEIVTESCRRL